MAQRPCVPTHKTGYIMVDTERLSASANFSRSSRMKVAQISLGAQRLSASANFSPQKPTEFDPITDVLNAFRHLRTFHNHFLVGHVIHPWCSTPFGICELFTVCFVDAPSAMDSAQRLSASANFSLSSTPSSSLTPRCSTPFGICELFTTETDFSISVFWGVLNAFRHLRTFHALASTAPCTASSGAQRLSASANFSHVDKFLNSIKSECAQRLSASANFSPL